MYRTLSVNVWLAVLYVCVNTNLWLYIHQAGLTLVQNSVNRLQTGAIQIIFILPIFNKSAEIEQRHERADCSC